MKRPPLKELVLSTTSYLPLLKKLPLKQEEVIVMRAYVKATEEEKKQ